MTQSIQKENLELDLRFAHIDGHTEFDFIQNKNAIVTTGRDCDCRIWPLNALDYSVQTSFPLEDYPYAVVANNDRIFIALENNVVKSFQSDDIAGDDEQTICRFTSNTTCLSLESHHELLAAGAADFTIKVISLIDQSIKNFEGHQGPILSLSIDPLNKYLASSSCDGSVIIWNIETKKIEYKWTNILPKSNDFHNSKTLCRVCWETRFGEFFIIPSDSSIQVYKRGQWDTACTIFKHQLLNDHVSIVNISKDSQFLAATTGSTMAIWKFDQSFKQKSDVVSNPIALIKIADGLITCLKFNPNNHKQICCTDNKGSLMILNIIDSTIKNNNDNQHQSISILRKTSQIEAVGQKTMDDLMCDLDDTDFDDIIDVKTEKSADTNRFKDLPEPIEENFTYKDDDKIAINADEPDMKPDEFDISAIKSKYEPIIFGDDDTNDRINNNDNNVDSIGKLNSNSELIIDGHRITGSELLQLCRNARSYQTPMRQQPFQSGSTPKHYKNRFMVWNSIGIIYAYDSDDDLRSIDVEFHDQTFHHSIHINNTLNYTIADLSITCLLLASNGDDHHDDDNDPLDQQKSRMYCMLFNTWDEMKEWQITLPKDEQFDCITAGQSFVAAMTTQRYLRVWTTGGIQTMIRCIDGPSINLSSYDNHLMAIYHNASQHPQDGQSISCLALKVDHRGRTRAHMIPSPVPVALSPKSTVYWAGFTDEGTPCVVDSDGIVRLYKNHFGSGWFPICATKQQANGKSDNYFIIGLSEIQSQIRCIYCKACRYPDTIPKPTLTILSFKIPLCDSDDGNNQNATKFKHEEECLRNRWLYSLLKRLSLDNYDVENTMDQAEKQIIQSLIKLFALALGADRESLALEVAKLLPNSQALEGAVRYAERQHHRSLAMKLVEMIREGDDTQNNEDDDDDNSDKELETLMSRKNIDKLRQLLKDDDVNSKYNSISLTPIDSQSTEFTSLKPKPLRKSSKEPQQRRPIVIESDDDNDDEDENDNINSLRPKVLNNQRNPFKLTSNNKQHKRKQIDLDDDDNSDNAMNDDNECGESSNNDNESDIDDEDLESNSTFKCFYNEKRLELFEKYSETIENENDLLTIAKQKFKQLSVEKRKKWSKVKSKNKMINLDSTTNKKDDQNELSTSKTNARKKRSKIDKNNDGNSNDTISDDHQKSSNSKAKITNFFTKISSS